MHETYRLKWLWVPGYYILLKEMFWDCVLKLHFCICAESLNWLYSADFSVVLGRFFGAMYIVLKILLTGQLFIHPYPNVRDF
jgi:hypothetical protein